MAYVPKTVLLAEDDTSIKEILDKFLSQRFGLMVTSVEDGAQAYEKIQAGKFDLIITDLMMPGMTGFDLIQMVRENPATSKIPIIVMSALNQKDKIVECAKLGISEFLVKPASLKALGEKVTKLLKLEA